MTRIFLTLTYIATLWLQAPLLFCQLYGQQEEVDQPLLDQNDIQPKLVKTQGSNESDNIHAMLQDKKGNVWFATTGEGVYRYDGKGFAQYTQKDGLSSNTVYSMIEDSSGIIWFGTEKGVSRYDGKSISAIPFTIDNLGTSIPFGQTSGILDTDTNEVWSIMQVKSGSLWFGTTIGLYCYDGIRFTRLLDDFRLINSENLKLKKIQCMLQDRSGTIWLGSGLGETEGLCRFDGKSITTLKPKIDGWIRQITEDKEGVIWLSTRSHGVWRGDSQGFVKFTILDDRVSSLLQCNQTMMQDSLGNMWFGGSELLGTVQTNSGIWRYDGMKFENFTIKDGLSVYGVWSMLEDTAGHIWVGTRNTGLTRFDETHFVSFSE